MKADDIDTMAAQWIVRRERGGWSKEDQLEFDAWLSAPGNRIAYLRLTDVWNRAGRLNPLASTAAFFMRDTRKVRIPSGVRAARYQFVPFATRPRGSTVRRLRCPSARV